MCSRNINLHVVDELNGEDLKVNWSARGGETAGEVEGGGGEFERGELLWVACNSTKFFSSHS